MSSENPDRLINNVIASNKTLSIEDYRFLEDDN